ncbi:MAG: Gfo/Idh/MocA family oxidoreductase [Flavobacteriales bacterium]|nr:Gfo/Idh/MocA family oxidoreductase [Flavobacteriales bacterium]
MNASTGRIRFAVVGCGHIGKRHAAMIGRHPEAELVALCDVLPQEEVGVGAETPYFQDLAGMLKAVPGIDVVVVCTPNGVHAEQSIMALEQGKNVICEKPMALTKASAAAVIATAERVGRTVFTVMQNRYSPPSRWIKSLVEEGRLGRIFMVQINCYWNRDARYYNANSWKGTEALDGGTLYTQFSHFLDMMYWLFGDITDIQARFADFDHAGVTEFEDSGLVNFRFLNGGIGAINYSTAVWDRNMESSLTVIGGKGSVRIGGQYMDRVEYCHIADYEMPELEPTNAANDYGSYKGSANNHGAIIDNVINALKGRNASTTNAMEGMKVVDIIERIYSKRNERSV